VISGQAISGTGALVKNGTAATTLEQANSYSGGTIVNQGTLRIGSGGLTGDIGSGAVSIASGATLEFNRSNAAAGVPDFDYKTNAKLRNVSGAGDIVLTGGGILFNYTGTGTSFADANSWVGFSGNLTIKGGSEFRTIRNGATAMGTGNVILGDATTSGILSFIEGNWTVTNNLQLVGSANHILNRSVTAPRSQKLQGIISGSGAVSFEDPAVTMTDINRGFILTGSNTLDGTLTIAAGVPLRVGGIPGNVDASNPGILAGLGGTLGAATVVNNGTLTFSRTDAHAVSNDISGSGALRVGIPAAATLGDTTTQILTYSGTASHTGTSTVNNGTLILGTGSSIGGSAITVESTATLTGTGTAAAPLTSAGTIAPGTGIGILSVSGNTILTGTLAIEVDGTSGDKLSVTGDLTLTGSTLTVSESGTGFTSRVIAECTGTLTGTPTAPEGYTVSITGSQLILSKASGNTYAAWATLNAGGGNANEDFDGDGTSNGVEYFMGQTGSTFTPNPAVVTTGGVSTVTWPRDPDADADFKVQVSTTLAAAGWTDIVPPNASIDESDPNEVVFTFPAGDPIKFCRLAVTVAP
jgi:autotransporter-associated beta strand protein